MTLLPWRLEEEAQSTVSEAREERAVGRMERLPVANARRVLAG